MRVRVDRARPLWHVPRRTKNGRRGAAASGDVVLARIVMKFGGTSVANVERIRQAARHVKREVDAGNEVAVVVSAMSGKTNELVGWVNEASPLHDAREYDAVVASGEQVTAGLMAIVLGEMGIESRSFQGWQVPIHTDDAHGAARITDIDPDRAQQADEGRLGAGRSPASRASRPSGRVTTLGRGGSDTSAVAIAAAVKADRCDIYTDVDGVYTTDPRIVAKAQRLNRIAFEEMLEMASLGAKVLMIRSVEMAMAHKVRLVVRSTFDDPDAPAGGAGRDARACPARWYAMRMRSWKSRSFRASRWSRTRPRSRCATSRTSRASPRRCSARWPTNPSSST